LQLLRQYALDLGDQSLALLVYFILGLKERLSFVISLTFECLDLLLPSQFFLQREP